MGFLPGNRDHQDPSPSRARRGAFVFTSRSHRCSVNDLDRDHLRKYRHWPDRTGPCASEELATRDHVTSDAAGLKKCCNQTPLPLALLNPAPPYYGDFRTDLLDMRYVALTRSCCSETIFPLARHMRRHPQMHHGLRRKPCRPHNSCQTTPSSSCLSASSDHPSKSTLIVRGR